MERITIEAPCSAAFAQALSALDHATHAVVTATENGAPWAVVRVSPLTSSQRSAFPCYPDGVSGDTRKRSQAGVMFGGPAGDARALPLVIERARRMHAL